MDIFCGYCHITRRVKNKQSYFCSDVNPLLLILLKAIQDNLPLPTVSRERYSQLRKSEDLTLERAFAAFACSYNGREFGGYVSHYRRRNGRVDDIIQSRINYYSKLRDSPSFRDATLRCCDYRSLSPTGCLVYCDKPYAGCTGYSQPFDHEEFWRVATEWSSSNVVLVSEYECPHPEWVCVASAPKRNTVAGGHKQVIVQERLFAHASSLSRFPPSLLPSP